MGPLVPDIIGNELNFVVALFIGIAFGFILEQAGFSTSKKLVGLFYGYDFTVLRVFFTAGVTAMFGVITLSHFGLLDINLIYINPTFLWSALAGGIIMGLGFVVGGFCPGTSVCAAAIGKIDAMIFIFGSFLGVFIFAEGYPLFEGLYKAESWGFVRVFDTVGISQGLFAFLLTVAAVGAFWATTLVENKVNGKTNPEFKPVKIYVALTGVALIFGFSAFFLPDIRDSYLSEVNNKAYVDSYDIKKMSIDEFAFRLVDKDKDLRIIDLRPAFKYKNFNLPNSQSFTLNDLFDKETEKLLTVKGKQNIFIADDELTAKKAAVIASKLGYQNIKVLEGGLNNFRKEILEYKKPEQVLTRNELALARFREKAARIIPVLIEENKNKAVPKKETKRVIGGC
ncbi:MAG: YeeE/YedE thiosulfate transporter family protein [Ignavibacteriaceae bacterium]